MKKKAVKKRRRVQDLGVTPCGTCGGQHFTGNQIFCVVPIKPRRR